MDSWWEIPLCAKFLEKVKEEIYAGKIVLTFIPKHAPTGFISELKRCFEKEYKVQFHRINLKECQDSGIYPVESFLFNFFDLDINTKSYIRRSASDIFNNIEYIPTQVFVFENLHENIFIYFKNFLNDLGRYMAGIQNFQRHKVLVIIDPTRFKQDDFVQETGIQKIHFSGCWGKLDNLLAIRYYHTSNNDIMRNLKDNFVASIARFDNELLDLLVESNDILNDYLSILKEYSQKKGWENIKYKCIENLTVQEKWERWAIGILDFCDDEIFYNSAYFMAHNRIEDLNFNIKVAFMEVLLPEIEDFRIRLVKCDKLVFPFKFRNGNTNEIIEDKLEFEIGEILYMFNTRQARSKGLSKGEKDQLYRYIVLCRSIRNDLSHLKMPKYENIKEFYSNRRDVYSILESENN